MASMAWAENAIIVKDDGNMVSYRGKCPKCGAVESILHNTVIGGNTNTRTVGQCMKRGRYDIYIRKG